MQFKIRPDVVPAGLSVLSPKWKVLTSLRQVNFSSFLNSNALIATLSLLAVQVDGRTIACTTFKTTEAYHLNLKFPTSEWKMAALLNITVQLTSSQ